MEVKKIITEAFLIFIKDKVMFIRNFLPTILAAVLLALGLAVLEIDQKLSVESPGFAFVPLLILVVVAFFTVLAKSIVHTHRSFILKEQTPLKELFKFTRRDFRFIFKFLKLNIVMMIIGFIIMTLIGKYLIDLAASSEGYLPIFIVSTITTLMMAFVWSRLALVLPSAAMDHSLTIQTAWHISDKYSAKLFFGVGLLPVVTDLVISVLPSYESHLYTLFIALIWSAVAIVEIGVLSLIYKEITEEQEAVA